MAGFGLIVFQIGYSVIYWAIQAIQENSQPAFINYIFPFGK